MSTVPGVQPDYDAILATPVHDGMGATFKDFLQSLLTTLWNEAENFSGKRPFGNSDWQWDVYTPLVKAGLLDGELDEDGYIDGEFDVLAADRILVGAIAHIFKARA